MGNHDDAASSGLESMAFGSFAGMTAKVFEHPFDLVKVRLQSQPTDRPLAFTGPLDCFRQTYSREGWRGLYRGISAPLVGAACENAVLFLVYNKCQDLIIRLNPNGSGTNLVHRALDEAGSGSGLSEKAKGKRRELSTPELSLAAAGAGAAASFVLTPIELIKCRMQVQMLAREGAFGPPVKPIGSAHLPAAPAPVTSPNPQLAPSRHISTTAPSSMSLRAPPAGLPPPEGPFQLIVSTVRTSGLRGLWLGQMGTLFRETGGSSAWFTAYEISSKAFLRRRQGLALASGSDRVLTKSDLRTYELMSSGALAGMSYNLVLFPADSVKSAMQTWAELHPTKPRLGFWEMASRIWKKRGIRGMYAGCGLTVARAAPSSAMIFLIYETLEKKFGGTF